MTLIIKNWSKHYEKSDQKKCKEMKWVAVPIKFDGLEYRRLMKMKDGIEIFGVWVMLLQLAGRMETRGVFRDGEKDLNLEDIELMTDCPLNSLKKAVSLLSSKDFLWIQDISGNFLENSEIIPTTGQDNTGQDNTKHINPLYCLPSQHLKERVLQIRQQKITDKTLFEWSNCVRLMFERDKRKILDIHKLIDECHDMEPRGQNGFTWRNNILSMSKLRQRWNEGKIFVGMNKKSSGW